jgi:hypothetical protein
VRDLVGGLNGQVSAVLAGWPAVIPCCAVCVAGYALGLRRSAAVLGLVVAVTVGTAAGLVAVQGSGADALVGPVTIGPVVTLVGATIVLIGTITVVICPRAARWGVAGGSP